MAPKIAIIYCRVSSASQTNGISLSAQQEACMAYLGAEKFTNVVTIQEIGSARSDAVPPLLKTLISKRNTTIVFYSVDRFSRNLNWGPTNLNNMIKNNNTIIFVRELLILNKDATEGMAKFMEALTAAKNESDAIADRVRLSISAYKAQGFHVGSVPYGYSTQPDSNNPNRKRLVRNTDEQAVISFIDLASTPGTSVAELNSALERFSPIARTDPIVVEITTGGETKVASNLHSSFSKESVAVFLNLYGSTNRGKEWTSGMIGTILKNNAKLRAQTENKENDEKKSSDDNDEKKQGDSLTRKQCWECRRVYTDAECCFTVFQFSKPNGVCVNCERISRDRDDEKTSSELSKKSKKH